MGPIVNKPLAFLDAIRQPYEPLRERLEKLKQKKDSDAEKLHVSQERERSVRM